MKDEMIGVLSRNSDKYGNPYELGFLREFKLFGFRDASYEQLRDYAERNGLI